MIIIETNGLTKKYGNVTAVQNLDLKINEGEIYGLLGPNGAGKSTTLNMLLNFVRPTSGDATILGYDPWDETRSLREHLGILPEGYELYDRLTAREHLSFAIDLKNCDFTPEHYLRRVHLDEDSDRYVGSFSKGMRQRLALSLALVHQPEVLILDEPSTGFDPHGLKTMRKIVHEERERGATVIFSSHIMQEVDAICDRVGIMNNGRLVVEKSVDELRTHDIQNERVTLHLDQTPRMDGFADIQGVEKMSVDGPLLRATCENAEATSRVISSVVESNIAVENITIDKPSLDEIFIAHTTPNNGPQEVN